MPDELDKIEWEDNLSRRGFIRAGLTIAGLGYLTAAAYPVYQYLVAPGKEAALEMKETEKELPDADKLPIGSALMFKFAGKPSILIHDNDGRWFAYCAVCTHLSCTVQYKPKENKIYCACHGGTYEPQTGKNIAGPPPKPLTVYQVEVADGKVIVRRS